MNAAIVVAAGKGRRMRIIPEGKVKQYLFLKYKPVLVYSLQALEECPSINHIILVVPSQDISFCQEVLKKYALTKTLKIVPGGKRRQDSVYAGLKTLSNKVKIVLVHDAVRPFITSEMVKQAISAVKGWDGVALGVPLTETVKIVNKGVSVRTLNREKLWLVQTPQVFPRKVLLKAHLKAKLENFYGTDDTSLVERIGGKIRMIEGSYENIKITTPTDLLFAEAILKSQFLND